MFIASFLVGALTAYYWGIRVGAFVATAVAVAFFVAIIKPEYATALYFAVGLYGGVVVLIAPKLRPHKDVSKVDLPKLGRQAIKKWRDFSKKNRRP